MAVFREPEFTIRLDLGMGMESSTVWTGDLTHDYITINAEYRT
ncbi:MAG: bifunctional glutamate N-acetyltransferase/amino-acid acetyltransferase ArgJ, partial [Zetaproteobacteria bacterium CG_4_8_14_3_um_filter_59_5]